MTQTEAESVKDLAKDTVEAIKVITERECEICQGKGRVASGAAPFKNCSKCDATGKLSWKWEPKVGEFVLIDNQPVLVNHVWPDGDSRGIELEYGPHGYTGYSKELIPILHWEEIERMLEGAGHWFHIKKLINLPGVGYQVRIHKPSHKLLVKIVGKSRQEAVMRSVIQLGKEIDGKSK